MHIEAIVEGWGRYYSWWPEMGRYFTPDGVGLNKVGPIIECGGVHSPFHAILTTYVLSKRTQSASSLARRRALARANSTVVRLRIHERCGCGETGWE